MAKCVMVNDQAKTTGGNISPKLVVTDQSCGVHVTHMPRVGGYSAD